MREFFYSFPLWVLIVGASQTFADQRQFLGTIETDSPALRPQSIYSVVGEQAQFMGLELDDPKEGIRPFSMNTLFDDTVMRVKMGLPVVRGKLEKGFHEHKGGTLTISFRNNMIGTSWIKIQIPLRPDDQGIWRGWSGDHYGQLLQVFLLGERFPQKLVFH